VGVALAALVGMMAKDRFDLKREPRDRYLGNDTSRCPGLALWGSKTKRWRRGDGGCLVRSVGRMPKHPCDDQYVDSVTGDGAEVDATVCRHFTMPWSVDSLDELRKLEGVGSVRVFKREKR
jgi:hypothetical protein